MFFIFFELDSTLLLGVLIPELLKKGQLGTCPQLDSGKAKLDSAKYKDLSF